MSDTTVGVTDDMVDAALNASWGEDGRPIWSFIDDEHPHALMTTALKAALIGIPGAEKGEVVTWQLVPVKPTEKMAEAGTHARWAQPLRDPDNSREIWASMLKAAPPAQTSERVQALEQLDYVNGEMWVAGRKVFEAEAEAYRTAQSTALAMALADRAPEKIYLAMVRALNHKSS